MARGTVTISRPYRIHDVFYVFLSVERDGVEDDVAWASYQLLPPNGPGDLPHFCLELIRVDEGFRRRGYARALIRNLVGLYPPGRYRWSAGLFTREGQALAEAAVQEFGPFSDGVLTLTAGYPLPNAA